jgi:hypothetical protein
MTIVQSQARRATKNNRSSETNLGLILGLAIGPIVVLPAIIGLFVYFHRQDSSLASSVEAPSQFSGSIAPGPACDVYFRNRLMLARAAPEDYGKSFAADPTGNSLRAGVQSKIGRTTFG